MLHLFIKITNKMRDDGPLALLASVVKRLSGFDSYISFREKAEFKKVLKINDKQKRFEIIYEKNYGETVSPSVVLVVA